MHIVADLQVHSRFSRAVSKHMTFPNITLWAQKKGIHVIATGDWTHPMWMREIERDLQEIGNGFLKLKSEQSQKDGKENSPLFLLATEVSCIYKQGGKGRRVHTLIWVPRLSSAKKINQEMTKQGCNLLSDGRPIIGLSNIQVAELVLTIESEALVIPAHVWTPWFSVYGSMSGFDSIEESFGGYAKHIYAAETGLSSDPAMNWRITELDSRTIISFSDAHSMQKLGREATVLSFDGELGEFTYAHLYEAIAQRSKNIKNPQATIAYTIEFHPEEGKYHYSGHRSCGVRWSPEQSKKNGHMCPVCGKQMTQGVMQRIEHLAGRSVESLGLVHEETPVDDHGHMLGMTKSSTFADRPPYVHLVPLAEILAECLEVGASTKTVVSQYDALIEEFGTELATLMTASVDEIIRISGDRVGQGIEKVRNGDIVIDPGYDGVFGVVKLWRDDEQKPLIDASREQLSMF